MNGSRVILDTNAIIALLRGHHALEEYLHNAEWIGISIISHLEYLAYSKITGSDGELFNSFSARITVVGLDVGNGDLIDSIIKIRKNYRMKLPDAIIAGTAVHYKAVLITGDKGLKKVKELNVRELK